MIVLIQDGQSAYTVFVESVRVANYFAHQSSPAIMFPYDFNSFPSPNYTNDLHIMREEQSMRVIFLQHLHQIKGESGINFKQTFSKTSGFILLSSCFRTKMWQLKILNIFPLDTTFLDNSTLGLNSRLPSLSLFSLILFPLFQ